METRLIPELNLELGEVTAKYTGITGVSARSTTDMSTWTVWYANKKNQGKLLKWSSAVMSAHGLMPQVVREVKQPGEVLVAVRSDPGERLRDLLETSPLDISGSIYLTYQFLNTLELLAGQGFALTKDAFETLRATRTPDGTPALFFPKLQPRFGPDELAKEDRAKLAGRLLYRLATGRLPPTEDVVETEGEGERLGAFDELLLDWVEEHEMPTGVGGLAFEAYEGRLTTHELRRMLFPHFEKAVSSINSVKGELASEQFNRVAELSNAEIRLKSAKLEIEREEAWLSERSEAIVSAEASVEGMKMRLRSLESLDHEIAARLEIEGTRSFEARLLAMAETSDDHPREVDVVEPNAIDQREIELDPDQFWPDDPRVGAPQRAKTLTSAMSPRDGGEFEIAPRSEPSRLSFWLGLFLGVIVAASVFLVDLTSDNPPQHESLVKLQSESVASIQNEQPMLAGDFSDAGLRPKKNVSDMLKADADLPEEREIYDASLVKASSTTAKEVEVQRSLADAGATTQAAQSDAPGERSSPPKGMVLISGGRLSQRLDGSSGDRVLRVCERLFGANHRECAKIQSETTAQLPSIDIASFFLGREEVDFSEYRKCLNADACLAPSHKWNREGYPVTGVSPKGAEKFCRWIGARLPKVNEWRFAVRGEDERKVYPWGSTWLKVKGKAPANMGVFKEGKKVADKRDGFLFVARSNSYRHAATAQGVVNLVGNVKEITRGEQSGYFETGGGFLSVPFEGRVTRSEKIPESRVTTDLGFRCAKSIDAQEPEGPSIR